MTRILVQRGSSGSASTSSNQNRPSSSAAASSVPTSSSSAPAPAPSQSGNSAFNPVASALKDEEQIEGLLEQITLDDGFEYSTVLDGQEEKVDDHSKEPLNIDQKADHEKISQSDILANDEFMNPGELSVVEEENEGLVGSSLQTVTSSSCPPPPPVPPPRPSSMNTCLRRSTSGNEYSVRIGPSRRFGGWPSVSARSSPTDSRPSSPRSHGETEGYNSADEHNPCYGSSYDDSRERQFEMDIRRAKGFEVRKMLEDGNCLFRAVADQVYGDSEAYDLVRQMCIDYMEQERDHFSQFITEGFTSYCKRKRRDKVYGNNAEIQAFCEMYNRPIHIYSYSTEPINIFQGSYNTDTPPLRLSYHHGNHYNSLVDPRRLTVGAGLGFSCLSGSNVDTDQVKAAIKAQQDHQIEKALLAEGRFYSDLELTEKEIERMVMEASRAEYLNQKVAHRDSTSGAEPSSSGAMKLKEAGPTVSESKKEDGAEVVLQDSVQILLSMGFSYLQAVEAYNIFGDDVDSMVCYLVETSSTGRRKGKATE